MSIATSLCQTSFDEAMDELDAPTYIIRVHPSQYSFAERMFGHLWRVSVVADASYTPTAWLITRCEQGGGTRNIFNEGC